MEAKTEVTVAAAGVEEGRSSNQNDEEMTKRSNKKKLQDKKKTRTKQHVLQKSTKWH